VSTKQKHHDTSREHAELREHEKHPPTHEAEMTTPGGGYMSKNAQRAMAVVTVLVIASILLVLFTGIIRL
jgi:hypothetical protein